MSKNTNLMQHYNRKTRNAIGENDISRLKELYNKQKGKTAFMINKCIADYEISVTRQLKESKNLREKYL